MALFKGSNVSDFCFVSLRTKTENGAKGKGYLSNDGTFNENCPRISWMQ